MANEKTTMSKSAFIRVRIEPELKIAAEAILDQLGISPTQAVTMLYKRIICDKAWPFLLNTSNEGIRKDLSKDDIKIDRANHLIKAIPKKEKTIQLGPNDDSEKEITLKMDLSVENNNSFVRGKSRSLKKIEEWVLSEYDFKKPEKDSDIYEITLKYTTYKDLDDQIEDIISEATSIADSHHCHMDDCDFYTFDGENSYPFSGFSDD